MCCMMMGDWGRDGTGSLVNRVSDFGWVGSGQHVRPDISKLISTVLVRFSTTGLLISVSARNIYLLTCWLSLWHHGFGLLPGNWYCYEAVVQVLFQNTHWPNRVTGSKAFGLGRVTGQKSGPGSISGLRLLNRGDVRGRLGGSAGLSTRLTRLQPRAPDFLGAPTSLRSSVFKSCRVLCCLQLFVCRVIFRTCTSTIQLLVRIYILHTAGRCWKMLCLPLYGLVVKTLSDTRWVPEQTQQDQFLLTIQKLWRLLLTYALMQNKLWTRDCRLIHGLIKQMEQLETAVVIVIWHTILERFNSASLSLQKVEIDLLSVVKLYDSLITFLLQMRDGFDETESRREGYVLRWRQGIQSSHSAYEATQTIFRRVMYTRYETKATWPILRWCHWLSNCRTSQESEYLFYYAQKLFGFLTEFESLASDDLRQRAAHLLECYPDVSSGCLVCVNSAGSCD